MSSDYGRFIYDYSMQLLSQDMLTNAVFFNSRLGANLRSLVLKSQPVQPLTNPTEEALSGSLRSDAAAVMQNARNVGEATDMVGVAKTAVAQISDALADMEDIIDKINAGELSASSSVVQSDYDALVTKIEGVIESTDFNGIYMLDSSKWNTDQIDSNGNVYIQAYKDGGFDVTFHSLDTINWSQLQGSDLETDLAGQLALVESYASDVNAVLDVYEGKQSSLEYQKVQLESQASLLEQAAAARKPNSSSISVEQLLLNLLLSDTGKIVDESS